MKSIYIYIWEEENGRKWGRVKGMGRLDEGKEKIYIYIYKEKEGRKNVKKKKVRKRGRERNIWEKEWGISLAGKEKYG